jgi:heme A synthase
MNQLLVTLYVWHLTAADKLKQRRDAGQGSLEYVAAIAVAAVIVTLIIGAVRGADVAGFVTEMINKIKTAGNG